MVKKIIKIFFIASLLGFLFTPFLWSGLISNDLTNRGKKYLNEGNLTMAIHEFSKAILADPQDQEARYYLRKLGLKEGLYSWEETPLSSMGQLTEKVYRYKQKMSQLKKGNQAKDELNQSLKENQEKLQKTLQSKDVENQQLRGKVNDREKEVSSLTQKNQASIKDKEKIQRKARDEVVRLNTDLFKLKDELVKQRKFNDEKEYQAKEVKKSLKEAGKNWQNQRLNYEEQIQTMDEEFDQFRHRSFKLDNEKKQYIKSLEDDLRKNKVELAYTNDRFLLTNFKLTDMETELFQKDKKVSELKDHLDNLERDLRYYQTKIQGSQARPKEFVEREDSEKIVLIKQQDRIIAELKEQLVKARQGEKGPLSQRKEDRNRIEVLKKQLEEMRLQLKEREESFEKKDAEYETLAEQLKDAKERLDLVEKIIQERDEQIKELENQLSEYPSEENPF